MKIRIFPAIILAAFASAFLAACGGESTENMVLSAKSYLEKNDSKAAIIQLKNALQKDPGLAEARFLLGQTLLRNGDAVSATVELRKAMDLKYPAAQVVPDLAKSLNANQEYRKLTDQFGSTALSEKKSAAELKAQIAMAYMAQGEAKKARSALQAAFDLVPDHAHALVVQARLEASEQHADKAFAAIDKALSVQPANAEALLFKGQLLLGSKSDLNGAIESYRKALSIDPAYLPAHAGIIDGLFSKNDVTGAKAQFDQLRKILPNHPQTIYFESQLAYIGNDNAKAGELIQKILKALPDNAKVLQLAGAIELKNESYLRAEDHLSKALQLVPSLTGARHLLAQTYLKSGQPEKALKTLEPLLSTSDTDAEAFSIASQAYMQTGDARQARANLLKAAKLNPTQTRSRVAQALERAKDGNVDAALSEIRIIAASDEETYADIVLINAYLRRGDLDKALAAVAAFEKKQPNKPYAANLRGRVQVLRKDMADARRSFERALVIDPLFVPAATSLATLDLADKKPDLAKKRFDGILAADPKNMQALLAIAGLRAQAGAPSAEVTTLLIDVVKLHPTDATPRLTLIEYHLAHKEPKQAVTAAQDAVAVMPQNPEMLDALGRAQLAAGERNQAINSFNKLASLQPRSPQAAMRLAALHVDAKDFNEARRHLKHALEIKPDLLVAQRKLIDIELASQHPEEALAIARTVRKQRPSDVVGFMLEGGVETARKNFSAAAEIYRSGLKQFPWPELAVRLHDTFATAKKQSDAESFATSWLRDHPSDGRFVTYLGEVALTQQNYQAAEGYFRRADQLLPNNPAIMNNLAWVMVQLNKPGAVNYAQKANAAFPDSPVLMDTLASALVSEKQFSKAIEWEKKALVLAPDAHGLRLSLAKMYIQAGDKAAARTELDKLAKLDVSKFPAKPEVSRLLAAL